MSKFFLVLSFVFGCLALSFFSVDVATLAHEQSGDVAVQNFYLENPDVNHLYVYPFYITDEEVLNKAKAGESFSFATDSFTLNKILAFLDARKVLDERVNGLNVACYYSSNIPAKNYVTISGRKINLQVAISGNTTTIGFPLILGGY